MEERRFNAAVSLVLFSEALKPERANVHRRTPRCNGKHAAERVRQTVPLCAGGRAVPAPLPLVHLV